jgi:hypothetical protein
MLAAAALALTLSAASSPEGAAAAAPAAVDRLVLVLIETPEGREKRILRSYGIKRLQAAENLPELQQDLAEVLGRKDVLGPLLGPTICPGARLIDNCDSVRAVLDTNLPSVIGTVAASRIYLLRPYATYWKEDPRAGAAYGAFINVDVLAQDGRRINSFNIGYVDGHCDAACVATAYAASAPELAAMFEYMVGVDIGYRTNAIPAQWRDKPRVQDFKGWANRCTREPGGSRVVRENGERLWIARPSSRTVRLDSFAWRGCNIFE